MNGFAIGQQRTASVKLGNGDIRQASVEVLGWHVSAGVRVQMIDAVPEVDLPAGDQTILGWDRFS